MGAPNMSSSTHQSKVESTSGVMQRYEVPDGPKLPVFLNGDLEAKNALIMIGGLYDGMISLPYHQKLSDMCAENGWTAVQPWWTSAIHGWATGSLKRDAMELECVVKHLKSIGKEKIVIIGSSTGCQDIMTYLLDHQSSIPINGAILQAPVSDRECFDSEEVFKAGELAQKMVREGKGEDLLPKDVAKAAFGLEECTAYRMWSLVCVGGDDDFFSSDLPAEQETTTHSASDKPTHRPLSETFGKLPSDVPLLFLFSGNDHGFPFKKTTPEALFSKWEEATEKGAGGKREAGMRMALIEGASHQVDEVELQGELVGLVKGFVGQL